MKERGVNRGRHLGRNRGGNEDKTGATIMECNWERREKQYMNTGTYRAHAGHLFGAGIGDGREGVIGATRKGKRVIEEDKMKNTE